MSSLKEEPILQRQKRTLRRRFNDYRRTLRITEDNIAEMEIQKGMGEKDSNVEKIISRYGDESATENS